MRHSAMAALALALGLFGSAWAADDEVVRIALRDGTVLVGRVAEDDGTTLRVVTSDGIEVAVPRASIVSRRPAAEPPALDPNYSRLMFGPTGRPLAKGDGYFSDYGLLLPGAAYGITDNFSLAGGFSVVPGLGLGEQVFYVSPKLGWNLSDRAAVSVGGLLAGVGGDGEYDRAEMVGIGYAVGTLGGHDRSVSLGLGAMNVTDGEEVIPILMLGGTTTLSKRVALVGETWIGLGDDFDIGSQPIGVAMRFFGDRLSADVGVIFIGELLDEGFPLPWLSVTYRFGGAGRTDTATAARRHGDAGRNGLR